MANKSGVVSIGLNVDYQKALQQMMNDFKSKLSTISNEAKKLDFSKDMTKQIGAVDEKIERISSDFKAMFDEINNQKIDASKFEGYQTKVTKEFEKIEKSINGVVAEISALDEKVGMLSGVDIASSMKKQFDELKESVLDTYQGLEKIFDLTKTSSNSPSVKFDKSALDEYKKTLAMINKLNAEATKTPTGTWGQLKKTLSEQEALLQKQLEDYDELKAKMASISPSSDQYIKFENELIRIQAAASATADKIQSIFDFAEDRNFKPVLGSGTEALMLRADNFGGEIDAFEDKVRKMIEANKEAQNSVEQTQTAFNTFTIKNGAIHVPVEVATKSSTLQKQLQETIDKLQEYAQKNSIIAKVKLTLDGGSASGYKKNEDITKQIEEGQNEPSVDISKAIKKTYVQAVREAEKTAKDSIKAIQAIFDGSPVKITPNKEAFTEDLSTMISSSLGKIANDTTGLNVNQELEKLVANLKEVSTSLSGNESFKFGLDEDSINAITKAIQNMADMIQRAFKVASNDDITAQWDIIESKFKTVAKENGSIDLRLNKNKEAMRELAVEYKKYLDMGGKEKNFSDLTSNSTTIDRLTEYYEELGKAAQEAAQQQEKAAKKPASTKVSSEEKDAIRGVTKQNKSLEEQAVKTGTALDNEGKKAQSAAEKFRKLAKEKGAAVAANRELAKAAKETADALEKEARIRKETGTKTGKGAVNPNTYATDPKPLASIESVIDEIYETAHKLANIEVRAAGLDPEKDASKIQKLRDEYKALEDVYSSLIEAFYNHPNLSSVSMLEDSGKFSIADLNEIFAASDKKVGEINAQKKYQEIYEVSQKLADLTVEIEGLDSSRHSAKVQELTAQYRELEEVLDKLVTEFFADDHIGSLPMSAIAELYPEKRMEEARRKYAEAYSPKAQKAFDAFEIKYQGNSNWGKVADEVDRLRQSIAGIDSQDKLDNFKQSLKDVASTLGTINKDNKLGEIIGGDRTFKDINEVRANIDSLFASMGKVNEKSIRVKGTDKLTAEVKMANGEIRKMTVSLDSNNFARFVDNGIVQFGRLRSAAEGVFKGIQSMVRIYLSPQDFIRYFRQGFDKVKEIDTAMTELKKVSDASAGDIAAYFDTAATSAKELGSSINEMIGATADWSRMGKSLPDSKELAEVAILYKNVGDNIDVEEATSSLVSTLQGFQMDAKDAIKIVDSFNEVIVRCPLISKCYI